MKTNYCLLILFLCSIAMYSQPNPNTYFPQTPTYGTHSPTAPHQLVTNDPSMTPKLTACGDPGEYKVGHNNDFQVQVSPDGVTYTDLFEYNTFVNSNSGSLSGVERSSFVSFDYTGVAYVKIKCMQYADVTGKVLIRPLSKNIVPTITANEIIIRLTQPATSVTNGMDYSNKLSVEINGHRYGNLQIFANKPYTALAPSSPTIVYEAGVNIYNTALNDISGKKIIIKAGAILTVPYTGSTNSDANNGKIVAHNGDDIYIEGGGILNGGIFVENVDGLNIRGRGIIDLTNYPKQYTSDNPNPYAYVQGVTIRKSKNINIDGITINDSQQLCFELTDSDHITLNNLKMFSRVVWGDGFHMRGTSNVTINDCYNRTSDDCIAIYASRHVSYDTNYLNRDAYEIKVFNSLLYADRAHPITIGWHGNQVIDNGTNIYNLLFDNIDILEHDENWVQPNGTVHSEYEGAIGIHCSDENKCDNFLFKNINVEDFTSGCLLTVKVMPAGVGDAATSGKSISNVRFENLLYNGTGEHKSFIQGINCDRPVDGVHFENLKINNTLISKLSDYQVGGQQMFETNDYAYNITFQEANNYEEDFTNSINGPFTIRNVSTNYYLQHTGTYVNSINSVSTNSNMVWYLEKIGGHYRIKTSNSATAPTMTNSFIQTLPAALCQGKYITTEVNNTQLTNQEWKIVGDNTSGYTINNAYTRGYLSYLTGITGTNTVSWSKKTDVNNVVLTSQRWRISPYVGSLSKAASTEKTAKKTGNIDKNISVFPNPTKDFLNIQQLQTIKNANFRIVDLKGITILIEQLNSRDSKIYVGDLTDGVYVVIIEKEGVVLYSDKFIKTH